MIYPPTPTPFPPGEAYFTLPTGYTSLWDGGTDIALQLWAWLGDGGTVIQLLLFLLILAAFGFVIVRFFQVFTRKDAES